MTCTVTTTPLIERELLKELARPSPARLMFQTLFEWLMIALLIALAMTTPYLLLKAACIVLIATRQHALLALMHDFSHYQFSRKRPWLNDLLGDVFTALPFFITIYGFRRNHFPHHRHVGTERDPNWVAALKRNRYRFPKTRRQVWFEIVKHAVGFYTLQELKRYTVDAGMAYKLPLAAKMVQAAFAAVIATLIFHCGLWLELVVYWLLPLSTVLMAILYVRDIGEHFGLPATGAASSRTVKAGWIERLFIAQNHVNYHAEHHLYPSVPFFRLPQLHVALMQNDGYRRSAVVSDGYLDGLLREVAQPSAKT